MCTGDIALERVQALLKVDTGDGSVYSHIVDIARSLSVNRPADALKGIDKLSHGLKMGAFRGAVAPDPELEVVADADAEDKKKKWCEDTLRMVRPSDLHCGEKVLGAVQNFMEDAAMFEWAGVGFGKSESYHIAMSLRKLAGDTDGLSKLRLWGKVLGTAGDYYVAEGTLDVPVPGVPAGPASPVLPGTPEFDVEPRGEGANFCAYWVCAGGTSSPWVRLPSARASHVVAARKFKHLMTGDLGSPVNSTPSFPGKEKHLLRAQIARVTATCSLAVAGYYKPSEEEGAKKNAIVISEEAIESFPGHEAVATLDGWVHAAPALLSTGRSTWPDLDSFEEGVVPEDALAKVAAQKESDPEKEMLGPIAPDLEELLPEGAEGSPGWNIKVYGDKGQYTFSDATKSYRITAVRSLVWPGAVTVTQGTRFANLYVGYAQKCASLVEPYKESGLPLTGANPFSSGNEQLTLAPGDVMEEPDDQEEQEEPQPPLVDDESDGEDMEPADE